MILGFGLRFRQADDALFWLELAALLEQFNTLVTLQDTAFCSDGAASF